MLLRQGLRNCASGRVGDRLAQRLLDEWDVLTAEDRAASLGLIGTLLTEAISRDAWDLGRTAPSALG